nr:small ubiquitin-related modifier 3 isoform X1 [Chelonoidis abingdonii]
MTEPGIFSRDSFGEDHFLSHWCSSGGVCHFKERMKALPSSGGSDLSYGTDLLGELTCLLLIAWEGVKTENDHINLKVAGQDGSVVQFKIKRHTPLNKLMKAYCERQGLSMRQIRFRFDGQPINETDTPAQLEMEDEDTIDVFQQQTGGVC